MEIYFKSKKLQKTLSRERELKKKYGTMAKVIMSRLDDLRYCQHTLDKCFTYPAIIIRLPATSMEKWHVP